MPWVRRRLALRRLSGAILAGLIAVTAEPAGEALAQAMTPPPGSPLRAQILDAVRPMVEAEVGKPVEFVVNDMRVLGEWAFMSLTPQRPGGGAVEYLYTRYQTAWENDMFGYTVSALLRLTPKGWLVYQYDFGATDVPWIGWWNYYPVPQEVFPPH
ncbi:MAG: hypothetical protein WD036_09815 [Bauldia sp.]